MRVHVVGDETFATRVHSTAVDYRYAADQVGEAAELRYQEWQATSTTTTTGPSV